MAGVIKNELVWQTNSSPIAKFLISSQERHGHCKWHLDFLSQNPYLMGAYNSAEQGIQEMDKMTRIF